MKNKRNLKGQKIYINEDPTKLNAQRLAELKKHIGILSAWSFEGSLYCKLINLEKIKIEDGGIRVIDRLLIDTPRSQQQGFQQRPEDSGDGRAGPPSLAERYARHGAETGADQQGTVATAGQQDRPALGDRRPGHPPPLTDQGTEATVGQQDRPALGDRRPGHPPPLTDQGTEATAGQQDRPALGDRRPGHPPPLTDQGTEATVGQQDRPALGDRRPGHPPPLTDQGTEATAGKQDRPALGGRRPGHTPPPALGDRRPGHPPPPALGDRRPSHPPPPALGDRRPGYPPPPALGGRRPGHPPPPALGGRRPGHPPPPALGGRRPGHPPPLTDGDLTMRSDHRKGGRYPRFQTEGTSWRYSLTTCTQTIPVTQTPCGTQRCVMCLQKKSWGECPHRLCRPALSHPARDQITQKVWT
ncbi:hypothetical protein ACOMHN_021859 [Nucella lapillus]